MKKNDMVRLGVGSIVSSLNFGQKELYLVIKNNANGKLTCLKERKDFNEVQDIDSFFSEIDGKKIAFDTTTVCHLSGKKVDSFVTNLSFEAYKNLTDLLPILFLEKKTEPVLAQGENISIGDLFEVGNQTFLLLDFTSTSYICSYFHENSKSFSFPFQMKKRNTIKRVGRLSTKQLKDTLKKIREKKKKGSDPIKIGSLVERKDRLYYVYGEQSSSWLAAQIDFSPLKKITVDGDIYPSSFKQKVEIIKSSKSFNKVCQAVGEEIKKNISCFYEQNKSLDLMEDAKKTSFVLKSGSWTRNKKTLKEYIALVRSNNRIVCLDFQKYVKGELYLQPFFPEELEVIGCLKKNVVEEILESLQDKYSSYYVKGEIKLVLLELRKN